MLIIKYRSMKKIFTILTFLYLSTNLLSQEVISVEKIGEVSKILLQVSFFEDSNHSVDLYKVNYTTKNIDGTAAEASGLLCLPQDFDGDLSTIIYGHGTVNDRYSVPSYQSSESFLVAAMAAKGYAAISADYLGLGDHEGFHPYLHADSEAWSNRDLLLAVDQYLDDEGISLNHDVITTGYSQGGHTAMALQRYIEEVDNHGFNLTISVPMSGPYNMTSIYEKIQDDSYIYDYVGYVARVILSYQLVYGDLYENLSDYFVPAVVDDVQAYRDENITLDSLNARLTAYLQENYGGNYAINILKEETIEELINNEENNFARAAQANNVYSWIPEVKTRLLYCKADDQVPYENSILASNYMNENGADDVSAIDINSNLNHGQCVFPALRSFFALLEEQVSKTTDLILPLEIYPNPASDMIKLPMKMASVEIYDYAGQFIKSQLDVDDIMDISDIPSGTYIVRSYDDQGKIYMKKLLIE